jgi:hypothetical protein
VKSAPSRSGSSTYPESSVIDGILVATSPPPQSIHLTAFGPAS